MASDIKKSKKGSKSAYLNIGVWYDVKQKHIHLTLPRSKWFHTTVSNDAESERYHRTLFRNLARALEEAGMPGPAVPEKAKQ